MSGGSTICNTDEVPEPTASRCTNALTLPKNLMHPLHTSSMTVISAFTNTNLVAKVPSGEAFGFRGCLSSAAQGFPIPAARESRVQ